LDRGTRKSHRRRYALIGTAVLSLVVVGGLVYWNLTRSHGEEAGAVETSASATPFAVRLMPTPSATASPTPTPSATASPTPSPVASPTPTAPPQDAVDDADSLPSVSLPEARVTVTYQLATKGEIHTSTAAFAAEVKRILDDPRGWRGIGIEFLEVPSGGDMTLWLADAAAMSTFSVGCSGQYSCRADDNVVINQDRWVDGAPRGVMDQVELVDYRTMVVNHEVGHWLGHGHVGCPGPGQPAPLMMQQSKGLGRCAFNPYPLPGERTAPNLGL
jgi:hypothetical protein